jgi:ABC-type multidrug transport system fused ATPase/permease subunit
LNINRLIRSNGLVMDALKEIASLNRMKLIVLFCGIIITSTINLIWPTILGELAQSLSIHEVRYELVVLISVLVIFKIGFQYLLSFQTNYLSKTFSIRLKKKFLNVLLESHQVEFDKFKKGDLIQRVFEELGLIQGKILIGSIYFIKDVLLIALIFVNILIISSNLFFSLLLIGVLIVLTNTFFGLRVKQTELHIQETGAAINGLFWESINGKKDIFIYKASRWINLKFDRLGVIARKHIKRSASLKAANEVVFDLLIVSFILCIVFVISIKSYSLNQIVTVVGYLGLLIWPLKEVILYIQSLYSLAPSIGRLNELLVLGSPMDYKLNSHYRTILGSTEPILSMENICFEYPESKKVVFKNFNFLVKKGIHLVSGRNGSGKTTLFELIARIYKVDSGMISFHLNQSDVDDSTIVRLVNQESFIFEDSLYANLLNSNSQENFVLPVLNLKSFIGIILPDIWEKLEVKIREGGKNLSGGERQLINIFRGLLSDPPLLIIDELTNNLPLEVYESILSHIQATRKEKITIISSHHNFKFEFTTTINI